MRRILCLHGSGSSGEILKRQIGKWKNPITKLVVKSHFNLQVTDRAATANICSQVPATYTFDFIDAPIECDPAPDLRNVYPGPYYQFFDQYSGAAMQEAIKIVEEVVDEDGPYDGVVGFSQVRVLSSQAKRNLKKVCYTTNYDTGCCCSSCIYCTATIAWVFRGCTLQNGSLLVHCIDSS
jgi:hypothetical protein